MAQYIDKSAVVAELERLVSNGQTKLKESEECKDYESYVALAERIATCINVLSFLDTLEVKEVKKEPVSKDLEEAISKSFIYHENHGDDFRSDKQIETFEEKLYHLRNLILHEIDDFCKRNNVDKNNLNFNLILNKQ